MIHAISLIARKELKRVFTDKRLLATLFVVPAVSIMLIYTLIAYFAFNFIGDVQGHVSSVVVSNPPMEFQRLLEASDTSTVSFEYVANETVDTYREAIKSGTLDVFMAFEGGFEEAVEAYRDKTLPAVNLYYNYGEEYSIAAYDLLVETVLPAYKSRLLEARFGDIAYTEVFDVKDLSEASEVVNKKKASGKTISGILPMLLSVFLFAGAMSVVLESVAGEKERGTLATMLVTPVHREAIAIGKMLSLSLISILTALSSLLGIFGTLGIVGLLFPEGLKGLSGQLNVGYTWVHFLQLFLLMLMLVGIYVGILVLLSSIAKSVKEAGSYVTPIYMVVMVISFMNFYAFDVEPIWKYALPIYGQLIGIKEILMFQMTMPKLIVAGLNAVVTIMALTLWIRTLFNNEKIIFSE